MHGSVHVHMVYSVRAKLAVRITARFRDLLPVGHGKDADCQVETGGFRSAGTPQTKREPVPGGRSPENRTRSGDHARSRPGCGVIAASGSAALGTRGEAVAVVRSAVMYLACTSGTPFEYLSWTLTGSPHPASDCP